MPVGGGRVGEREARGRRRRRKEAQPEEAEGGSPADVHQPRHVPPVAHQRLLRRAPRALQRGRAGTAAVRRRRTARPPRPAAAALNAHPPPRRRGPVPAAGAQHDGRGEGLRAALQ